MRAIVIALSLLALSACATVQKLPAASDVHALLIAIRDDDRQTFDALVDHKALKRQMEAIVVDRAGRKDPRLAGVAALLAPSLADAMGDALLRPDVFRSVAEYYGYRQDTKIPNVLAISQALRQLPDGRVCAISKKDGPCLLDFTRAADGRWKLSGFEGDVSMLRLKS